MSDLKHLTREQLLERQRDCEKYIALLKSNLSHPKYDRYIAPMKSKLSGQQERLRWINKYMADKGGDLDG